MSLKKKKHNSLQDMENRNNFPDFVVVATPMSTFSKILNLAVDKRELLKSISYKKGLVTIKMENGKDFIGMLSDLHVDFAKNQGLISYNIKSVNDKVSFYQTTNISNKQWDVINSMLCLAGSTRGEDIFGTAYKQIGYVNTALKALKFFQ